MATGLRQEMRQGQSLVMTQQLQQAIKLLQLSNIELSQFVVEEVEKNPFLDLEEPAAEPSDTADREDRPSLTDRLGDVMSVDRQLSGTREMSSASDDQAGDADPSDIETTASASEAAMRREAAERLPWSGPGTQGPSGEQMPDQFETRVSKPVSLREHLMEQMGVSALDPAQRLISQYLIDTLDEAGYLADSTEAIAERLGCAEAEIDEVLEVISRFDPPGVFARDLADCLAIQLRERDRLDPAMAVFVENLGLLADRKIDELRSLCEVDQEDLREMIEEIRALNPKPGSAFQNAPVAVVVPDVFVRRGADGIWVVELNTDTLPKVLVNRVYYAEISGAARKGEDKAYLSECLNNANWLVKALDQRAQTILKVASELVIQQENFFLYGVSHLRPLNLRQIADEIEMHESTVSRVTSNKYLSCARGNFDLKYFFTSAISSTEGGDAHSAESVRHRIKAVIDSESPKAILSDDKIVTLLKSENIDIARRTVAKYREAMRIPSSVQRRRLKSQDL